MDPLRLENEIIQTYSAADLVVVYRLYLSDFLAKTPGIFTDWGLDTREFAGASIRKKLSARALAIVISDPHYLERWLTTIPREVHQALYIIAWEGRQTIAQLENDAECSILLSHRDSSDNEFYSLKPDFCLFQVNKADLTKHLPKDAIDIDLPTNIKNTLQKVFTPPEGYNLSPVALPENSGSVFADQGQILKKLPLFQSLLGSQNIQVSHKGDLTQKSLKELSGLLNLTEFYLASNEKGLKYLRLQLIFHLHRSISAASQSEQPLGALKQIIEHYCKLSGFPNKSLLKHIIG